MSADDATELVQAVAAGRRTVSAAVDESLRRLQAVEESIQAWVEVDEAGARAAAASLDGAGVVDKPLAGLVLGVKDIYDVAGLPTRLGAAEAFHYTPERDATAVAKLRTAGAIILGKTHTTTFAYLDPAPTRNPWNLEHTPGGSSSGSAATVAAGVVPAALGTQTVGSVLRPAGYCGIVGLKPTHGRISTAGIYPLSPSFDHAGVLCRSVRDAALLLSVLAGHDEEDHRSLEAPVANYLGAVEQSQAAPRLAWSPAFHSTVADAAVTAHLQEVVGKLAAAGARIDEVDLPATAEEMRELGQPVMRGEAASVHARHFNERPQDYPDSIGGLIEAGIATGTVEYLAAREAVRQLGRALDSLLQPFDAWLLPTAPSTAPRGLSSTGNGIFCAPASFTGLPAIALPSGLDEHGLPFSVQLVGRHLDEARLLAAAAWVERVLAFDARPSLAQS